MDDLSLAHSKDIGRIKGKSALMILGRHPEYREKYNRHWKEQESKSN